MMNEAAQQLEDLTAQKCETCKHWGDLFCGIVVDGKRRLVNRPLCYVINQHTDKDFGCVKWEKITT
jgi:hypothetical protein